jgi:nucleoside-diphosphate-sugar epimerase
MEYPKRLVPSIISSLLKNSETQCLSGDTIRDFLHVEDVASAFVTLLESNVTGPINIASGNPIAIKDMANTIADQLGKRDFLRFKNGNAMPKEPRLVVAQTDRLENECGWLPVYDLKHGIEQTIAWWKANLGNRAIEEMLN